MTREHYLFLRDFHKRLIQPIIESLNADQQRKHPFVNDISSREIADMIRSLNIHISPHSSFHVEYTCKGMHVKADWKEDSVKMEFNLWTLHNMLAYAKQQHVHIPHSSDYDRLIQGVYGLLQIINPERYGKLKSHSWTVT